MGRKPSNSASGLDLREAEEVSGAEARGPIERKTKPAPLAWLDSCSGQKIDCDATSLIHTIPRIN